MDREKHLGIRKIIKTLKTKVFNKEDISWDDLKVLNISRNIESVACKDRWSVATSELPGTAINCHYFQPTKARWKTARVAFEYEYLIDSQSMEYFFADLEDIKQGIVFMKGKKSKKSAIKILKEIGLQGIVVDDLEYSGKLTIGEIKEMQEDGHLGFASDETRAYFHC